MSTPLPPPPPPGGAVPPPAWGHSAPPPPSSGYDLGRPTKPPRPRVPVGAILTVAGGVLLIVGAVLPWLSIGGETGNGFDDYITIDNDRRRELVESPGSAWVFFALVIVGLGIALYFAGRVLAVAIIAIVCGGFALAMVAYGWTAVSDTRDLAGQGTYGAGLPVGLVAAGVALAGAITATAKRRRWP